MIDYQSEKIGIIAGQGELPKLLIQACQAVGCDFFVLAMENQADHQALQGVPCVWNRLGAVGKSIHILKEQGVTALVLGGAIKRPSWLELRPDLRAAELLAKMGPKAFGDDGILSALLSFLEKEGFKVLGPHELLAKILAPQGVIGQVTPSIHDLSDIDRGLTVAKALGEVDVGQGVVVQQGIVLAVEAVEGTDGMLSRVPDARLRVDGLKAGGVLIKAAKPQQDRRVDLPTIGLETVKKAQAAGLAGIALEAGQCLILDQGRIVALADKLGIFIYGVGSHV